MSEEEDTNNDEWLWSGEMLPNMYSDEVIAADAYPTSPAGGDSLKRKEWLISGNANRDKLKRAEHGESSTSKRSKHQSQEAIKASEEQASSPRNAERDIMLRGAVGPEPPLPP